MRAALQTPPVTANVSPELAIKEALTLTKRCISFKSVLNLQLPEQSLPPPH